MGLEETAQRLEIGRGRTGRVFQSRDSNGRHLAIKVITGEDLLTKLTNYFFTGAPNPYAWNIDTIQSAHYRREILKELLPYWTDSKVRVANSLGARWNDEFKAYELATEFIDGRHAILHHPFSKQREGELSDLVNNVMKPLQQKLIESGFDGLVWQTGKGIPVASANFMLEQNNGNYIWAWVDLESGVPAMGPLNPVSFFSFYLPKSIKHRRPLFDDVDIGKLKAYISAHKEDLESRIGAERYFSLLGNIDSLEFHQQRWKSMRRAHRSITYQLKKGNITQEQADWYFERPYIWADMIWYGREAVRLTGKFAKKLVIDLPRNIFNKIISINYREAASKAWRFVSSEKYRLELARDYVHRRIDTWRQRNQLQPNEADYLMAQLETETTSPYLTDLFVHAGFKFVDWLTAFGGISSYISGITDYQESGLIVLLGGSAIRTAYTLGKMGYTKLRFGQDKKQSRLIALAVGIIPIVGIAAYPVQMTYSTFTEDKDLGKFLLYDIFTRIGQKIPVYGGRDTLTEHFFNHFPDLIVRNRQNINS